MTGLQEAKLALTPEDREVLDKVHRFVKSCD